MDLQCPTLLYENRKKTGEGAKIKEKKVYVG